MSPHPRCFQRTENSRIACLPAVPAAAAASLHQVSPLIALLPPGFPVPRAAGHSSTVAGFLPSFAWVHPCGETSRVLSGTLPGYQGHWQSPNHLLPATESSRRKSPKEEENASLWKVEARSAGLQGSVGYLKTSEVTWWSAEAQGAENLVLPFAILLIGSFLPQRTWNLRAELLAGGGNQRWEERKGIGC